MIDIFLDNNVFDFLYEQNIDILNEFPKNQFRICISKEIKFETEPIKDLQKQRFIQDLLENISLVPFFGFFNKQHSIDKQRGGGWDEGIWSDVENETYRAQLNQKFLKLKKNPKHDLYTNETDIDLAVRSIKNIVLTFDAKKQEKNTKKGPLNDAFDKNYKVVFLTDIDVRNDSLVNFVKRSLENRGISRW